MYIYIYIYIYIYMRDLLPILEEGAGELRVGEERRGERESE